MPLKKQGAQNFYRFIIRISNVYSHKHK